MVEFPTGTVTFLFSDLEVSTRLWEREPEAMRSALGRHDLILRDAVSANGGRLVKGTGDGIHAAFATADAAVGAAVESQLALGTEPWGVSDRCECGWVSTPVSPNSVMVTTSVLR